jgi:hypothetical protein
MRGRRCAPAGRRAAEDTPRRKQRKLAWRAAQNNTPSGEDARERIHSTAETESEKADPVVKQPRESPVPVADGLAIADSRLIPRSRLENRYAKKELKSSPRPKGSSKN